MEIDIIEPGYYYHIYNRGINRQVIFEEDTHYLKFLSLCKKYLPERADVLAYCLLPNHFHFLLHIKKYPDRVPGPCQGKESLFLSHLFNSYAQYFNKRMGRTGSLFQRPFKRKRINDENYLRQVIYYIHRNPLHHNLVAHPGEWIFSSYTAILNYLSTFVNKNETLSWFDNRENFLEFHRIQFEIDRQLILEE